MPNINLNYKMVTDIKNNFFTNNRFIAAESLPAEGDFVKGDLIVNIGENANDEAMWLCVESGNPGVWEVVGAGAGGGSSKIVTLKSRVVVNEALSEVNIGVSGFNKATDTLIVFNNARFMVEGVDYEINIDSTKIVAMNGNVWNEELANDFVFDFVVFKMMNVNENGEVIVSSANEIVKLKNTVVVNEAVNEVEIGINGFNEGDDLTVYKNSVYMMEGIDYEINADNNKIILNEACAAGSIFAFEVIKTVAKINPDAVVGMEHLNEDVREAIEAAGNIDLSGYAEKGEIPVNVSELANDAGYLTEHQDLSGYATKEELNNIDMSGKQDKSDNNLVTTDKTIVGAINELFQNVSNGKILIAEALTDRGVDASATETFVELANKILSIPQGIELPMKTPSWTANIDTVTATLDTQDNLFTQFRVNEGAWQTSNVFSGLTGGTTYKFEGMYGASRVSSISATSPKANQSAPGVCTASNITQTSVTITAPSGCMIRYNGTNYSSPKTFTGVASSYHDFYAYKPSNANKNESPVSSALNVRLRGLGSNSPGPEHLIKGTATEGYFGTVNISTKGGLVDKVVEAGLKSSATTSDTTPVTFLKFIQNGKFIYIAKTPFKYRTSGTDGIYNALDYDKWAAGTMSTTATIDGRNYIVRAPKIGNPLSQTLTYSTSTYSTGFDYNLFVLAWSDFAMPAGYFIPTANRVTIQYGDTSDEFVMLYTSGHSVSFWAGSTTNMIYVLPVLELQ